MAVELTCSDTAAGVRHSSANEREDIQISVNLACTSIQSADDISSECLRMFMQVLCRLIATPIRSALLENEFQSLTYNRIQVFRQLVMQGNAKERLKALLC